MQLKAKLKERKSCHVMKFIGCDVPNRKHTFHKMGSSISFLFMFGIIQITCGVQASRKTLVGAALTCAAIVTKLQNSIIQRHKPIATMSNKWEARSKKNITSFFTIPSSRIFQDYFLLHMLFHVWRIENVELKINFAYLKEKISCREKRLSK